jgi:hypothetical protein
VSCGERILPRALVNAIYFLNQQFFEKKIIMVFKFNI